MPFGLKKAADPGGLKLFNLDLHFAVIADVKHTLKTLYGCPHVADCLAKLRSNVLRMHAAMFPAFPHQMQMACHLCHLRF